MIGPHRFAKALSFHNRLSHMSSYMRVILAVIAVLVVLVAVTMATNASRQSKYLAGYWVGDAGFLEKSQLSDMQMFVGPATKNGRQGYLIMKDLAGNFICNRALELQLRPTLRPWAASRTVDIDFDHEPGAEPDVSPVPATLTLTLSVMDGTLTLADGAEVWAFMYKDLATSAVALAAYADPHQSVESD